MYIEPTSHYYVGTELRTRAARFLLLIQPKQPTIGEECRAENTYAIVRRVALRQFGHFMMGRARLRGNQWITVSGAYGGDGLPRTVDALPKDAVLLPRELYDAWSKGGGHNGAGSEAKAIRVWALETFKKE